MLSHKNLLCNSAIIRRAFGNTSNSSAVFWLPLYHDMGLIGGVIQPIYCGGSCTLVSPAAFLQRPVLWLETISRTRATVSGGPDFAYDLCVRKVSAKERASLDLSRWKVAFVGLEPIRPNPGTLCHRLRPASSAGNRFAHATGLPKRPDGVGRAPFNRPPSFT